jgi:hypothetical protein
LHFGDYLVKTATGVTTPNSVDRVRNTAVFREKPPTWRKSSKTTKTANSHTNHQN